MYEYKATVVRVIDGDTLEVNIDLGFKTILNKEKLRLIGIDTPELRSKNLKEREHAKQAKALVEHLLPVGSDILIQTVKDAKGKYGRYLAKVRFVYENKMADLTNMLIENDMEKRNDYDDESV